MELHFNVYKNIKLVVSLIAIALIFLTIIHVNYPLVLQYSSFSYKNSAQMGSSLYHVRDVRITYNQEQCDIFTGEWVPDPDAPYYTNTTCWAIHEHQNCMKYGRPDSGFLKWRWKPDGCDLPVFDPYKFLDIVRDKSMAFIGDSVGRNQMQSMICLLSRVEYPIDMSPSSEEQFKRWKYQTYNFTLVFFKNTFLIRSEEGDSDGPTHTGLFNLFLDEPDLFWTTQIDEFDYLILNSGHWFNRTSVYYENRTAVGCHYCQLPNTTDLPLTYAYRRAFRTAFGAINSRPNFRGITFLRTYAPSHFEGGAWNSGGNCVRKRPFNSDETILEGTNLDMYMIELEEFRVAEKEGERKKKIFRLMDATQSMLLRPDGHPSRYGHWPNANVTLYNDCVHWCLPGPIDSWADFLFHMLKIEARKEYKGRRFRIQKKMQ